MQTQPRSRADAQDAAGTMTGKTILFTGASRGMGRFAAIELARRGAKVVIVGHNYQRGAAAVEMIHCYSLIHDDLPRRHGRCRASVCAC